MRELKKYKNDTLTRANRLDIIQDFANGYTLEDGTMLPLEDFSTEGLTKLARYIIKISREEKQCVAE